MSMRMATRGEIERHLDALRQCALCRKMQRPVVVGRPVASRILLVGQAPGDKEPKLGRPFAWTAGKTLFKWFESATGWTEDDTRDRVYFAAVCRCFPGKKPQGGDRVPDDSEIACCSQWLDREFELLKPQLVIPVGKLAMRQFMEDRPLVDMIGHSFRINHRGWEADVIPLPHPSGASPWHRMEPGKMLLSKALAMIATHPTIRSWATGE